MYLSIPKISYKCPSCGNLYFNSEYSSWNTVGIQRYTDGISAGPMMPNGQTWITQCPKCGVFFSKKYLIAMSQPILARQLTMEVCSELFGDDQYKLGNYDTRADYSDAVKQGLYFPNEVSMAEKEAMLLDLRISLWRQLNHIESKDFSLYQENCEKILQSLRPSSDENLLILAEIYRNLGKFAECFEMLNKISDVGEYKDYIFSIIKYSQENKREIGLVLDSG